MFNLTLDNSKKINVNYKKHTFNYALDGSLPNPLEAFYATLNGCAGVFAHKACAELGLSSEGIEIVSRPVVAPSNPMFPIKFETTVSFPERFTDEQKEKILASVSTCAVKEVVKHGADVEFIVK